MRNAAIFILGPVVILSLILSSCGETSPSSAADFIPDVEIQCSPIQVNDGNCSSAGRSVFVGISDQSREPCQNYLIGYNAALLKQAFLASGFANSTFLGSYMTATIRNWQDEFGATITNLPPASYFVCAFIDSNSNQQYDAGEPVGAGRLTSGVVGPIIDDWYRP
jgi:hypothetical protein